MGFHLLCTVDILLLFIQMENVRPESPSCEMWLVCGSDGQVYETSCDFERALRRDQDLGTGPLTDCLGMLYVLMPAKHSRALQISQTPKIARFSLMDWLPSSEFFSTIIQGIFNKVSEKSTAIVQNVVEYVLTNSHKLITYIISLFLPGTQENNNHNNNPNNNNKPHTNNNNYNYDNNNNNYDNYNHHNNINNQHNGPPPPQHNNPYNNNKPPSNNNNYNYDSHNKNYDNYDHHNNINNQYNRRPPPQHVHNNPPPPPHHQDSNPKYNIQEPAENA